MRRSMLSFALLFLSSLAFAGNECVQLFLKAKEQFRMSSYAQSLQTLEQLDAESQKPGNEAYRAQLAPSLAFYRGANLAALGKTDEAKPYLDAYFTYQPNASLDPSAYPPKVIAAFDQVRKEARVAAETPAETGTLATSYRAFKSTVSNHAEEAGEDWANGPIGYLLTGDQKRDFNRLSDPVSRSEFITAFWKAHDPKPETEENEARDEFERRVAFADSRFAQDETRGSMTDRGMVFILLGPPTWIGRKPLSTGDDRDDPAGMSFYTDSQVSSALKGIGSSAASQIKYDHMTGPNNKLPNSDGNYREVWHYRRELLPAGISFQQVDAEFITRAGYGRNILQREARVLTTLETARENLRAGSFTRLSSH
jgi:GWxTD domain-containing protein